MITKIFEKGRRALLFSLLITAHFAVPQVAAAAKGKQGVVAVRLTSNADYWQYLYFKNSASSEVENFFAMGALKRFKYTGDNALKLLTLPAGRYYWSSYHTSGGGEAGFARGKNVFTVHPGKTTYIGDIKIAIARKSGFLSSSLRVSFPVSNNAAAAKKELRSKYPETFRKYPFMTKLTSLK